MARALLFISYRQFKWPGLTQGAAGTVHFEPGGVTLWSKAKKTHRDEMPD
jgi:hypothetical protein